MTRKRTGYNLRLCFLLRKKCSKPRTLEWYFGRKESIGSYKSSQIIENFIVTKHDTQEEKGFCLSPQTHSQVEWRISFLPSRIFPGDHFWQKENWKSHEVGVPGLCLSFTLNLFWNVMQFAITFLSNGLYHSMDICNFLVRLYPPPILFF